MQHLLPRILPRAACALAVALALGPAVASPRAMAQPVIQPIAPAGEITLSIGQGRLVSLPAAMTDVFIADESIADIQVKSRRQLYLFGVSGGQTSVYASNAAGDIIWSASINVGSNIGSLDQMLAMAMPEADIRVATMSGNMVLLTGTVAEPEDVAEAERLVLAFMGEGANVVSRLRTATPLQVNLRVRFAEVNRSLVRALGANLATIDGTGGFRFGITQGRDFAPFLDPDAPLGTGTFPGAGDSKISRGNSGTTLGGLGRLLGLDIAGALDLAERQGLVTTLSEPNLTALSGETAQFLAGGEFPIPLSQGLGTTTIEYKNYGVSLAYTPTVLSSGRISIRVRPEVSELSTQGAITLEGFQIPALTVRRAETTVELGSGQSFMIAGLLSNSATSTIEKAPGAGDIPILGNLFRSTEFRKGETELVIIVTPYLVKPIDERDVRLPTDGFATPTVAEQLLMNREVGGRSGAPDLSSRPMPTQAAPATGQED